MFIAILPSILADPPHASFLEHLPSRVTTRELSFLAWCSSGHPSTAETLVRTGYDGAVVDMQHGAFDIATAALAIALVAGAGRPTLVRVPVGECATAARMLDAGAAGVIMPMIDTPDDARAFVATTKLPPVGQRSWGTSRAAALTGLSSEEYFRRANALHLCLVMVETQRALEALDQILAVPGVDGVFAGPSDLSVALSEGSELNPTGVAVERALDRIAERCQAHGRIAAAFCADGQRANVLASRGFAICSAGTDQLLLQQGGRAALAAARSGHVIPTDT